MRISALLLLLSWLAVADAAVQPPQMEELAQARAKWKSQHIENYAFMISNTCSCPLLQAGPLVIVVEDGKLRRTFYAGGPRDGFVKGQSIRRRSPLRVTVDGLFEVIEKRLKISSPAQVKIKYDDKLGYPALFEYVDSSLKDGHAKIELKNFKRL
ncbi:MAG TPA: DUF6174 domain-containing protein [Gammaproteobacteria bacterium]|nr:DUF6174 domain-containing protein [Gammaproteobacteria bacterium]